MVYNKSLGSSINLIYHYLKLPVAVARFCTGGESIGLRTSCFFKHISVVMNSEQQKKQFIQISYGQSNSP